MPSLAVVLYSYAGRRDRQRLLARLCYRGIARIPHVGVFVTVEPDAADPPDPCYRPLPLDVPVGYEYLPDKTLALLRWFAGQAEYDYLLKCDDDLILDPAAIRRLVDLAPVSAYEGADVHGKPPTIDTYNCHRGKCLDSELNEIDTDVSWAPPDFSFAAGTCYLLSKTAARHAVAEADASGFDPAIARLHRDNRGVGAEDWLVAWLLWNSGIVAALTMRVMYCPDWFKMLKQFRWELAARMTRASALRRCMGVVTSNRAPTPWEQLQIRAWLAVSRFVPPP